MNYKQKLGLYTLLILPNIPGVMNQNIISIIAVSFISVLAIRTYIQEVG
jgi:hypothetical protein|tara:strand:- start:72 stop:218 length:147 start_codon:yes stop_codon:yes gene_type:complete